tara:strand:- start:5365 stop:5646 length:282 start_codon:yes stop_codon:yes gene_type:complete
MKSERIRNRNRLTTKLFSDGHSSTSESIFHEIDNLDTKTIEQAEDNYQEVFIRIRELLTDKPWCCDNAADTLSICQIIADDLRSNLLIRKEGK